jgi:hypothetical protein
MTTSAAILDRLDRIEASMQQTQALLRQIMHDNSPASLSVDEKARILAAAMRKGKKALKAAERQINGQ